MKCHDCQDTGRVSNGRSPGDPAYDDGPCPHCEAGSEEFAAYMRARAERVLGNVFEMFFPGVTR